MTGVNLGCQSTIHGIPPTHLRNFLLKQGQKWQIKIQPQIMICLKEFRITKTNLAKTPSSSGRCNLTEFNRQKDSTCTYCYYSVNRCRSGNLLTRSQLHNIKLLASLHTRDPTLTRIVRDPRCLQPKDQTISG